MADALPTPSEPADSPTGSDRVFAQPSAEDSAARSAEEKDRAIKRRAHRKSRFGCKKCKVRRIKCDERKPECTNCRNRQVRCDYLPAVKGSSVPAENVSAGPADASSAPSPFPALSVDDVELMYHWTTSTSATLSAQSSGATFWRTQVTEIGIQHHHVLRLILAITAIHLSRFRPQRREEYLALADHHHASALPKVTAELAHLDQDNGDAVFLSVQLVCFLTWARGPQPGEFLAFGENGRSDWLLLFRGIRTTCETVGHDNITRSLAPSIRARSRPLPNVKGTLPYEEPLAELYDFIQCASASPAALEDNIYAHKVLLECYANRYGGIDSEYHVVFAWLYRMKDEFLDALQRHDAVPLVVYAHFALLMNDMEGFWYMKGWTNHVLAGIWGILRDEDRVHIRWPISVCPLDEAESWADEGATIKHGKPYG